MRPKIHTPFIALLFLIVVSLHFNLVHAQIQDPWYIDVPHNFWAYQSIRTLWEEQVTDGYVFTDPLFPSESFSRFLPINDCSRAEFVMMLAKLFRLEPLYPDTPSFTDLPKDFHLYFNKPAYGHIESVNAQGYLSKMSGSHFLPLNPLTREEAAVLLIHALGLNEYAGDIPQNEVNQILSNFSDANEISPDLRQYIAAAVHLRILYGYGTTTRELRPKRIITRDEAAVILYRSCLIRVKANPMVFNPYGDGEFESTIFVFHSLKNRNIESGVLQISDLEEDSVFFTIPFSNIDNILNEGYEWDGTKHDGVLLPPDTYYYSCTVTDRQGNTFRSSLSPVIIDRKTLGAYLLPTIVKPKDEITVYAQTQLDATSVYAIFEDQTIIHLVTNPFAESDLRVWSGKHQIPGNTYDSSYSVSVFCQYPYAKLSLDLTYTVVDPLSLSGFLDPIVLKAGETIQVNAHTSDNAVHVEAHFPFTPIFGLSPNDNRSWCGSTNIPLSMQDGIYTMHLKAASLTKTVWIPLQYEIRGSIFESYRIILSD